MLPRKALAEAIVVSIAAPATAPAAVEGGVSRQKMIY